MKRLIVFFLSTAALQAQSAQLNGLITDASQSVVPTAEVVVLNTQTGLKRTVQTNQDGYYTVPFLPPGEYTVTVRLTGFQSAARDHVALDGQWKRQRRLQSFIRSAGLVPRSFR